MMSQRVSIKEIWASLRLQLTSSNKVINIPDTLYELWSAQELTFIGAAYTAVTGMKPMLIRDGRACRVQLGPSILLNTPDLIDEINHASFMANLPVVYRDTRQPRQEITASEQARTVMAELTEKYEDLSAGNIRAAVAARNAGERVEGPKIARPPNAWILFRKHHHAEVAAAHPELTNVQLSGIIANMWQTAPQNVRNVFKAQSVEAARAHKEAFPLWKYQPRRPADVKRRRTKAKMRAEAATHQTPIPDAQVTSITQSALINSYGENGAEEIVNQFRPSYVDVTDCPDFDWTPNSACLEFGGTHQTVPRANDHSVGADLDEILV